MSAVALELFVNRNTADDAELVDQLQSLTRARQLLEQRAALRETMQAEFGIFRARSLQRARRNLAAQSEHITERNSALLSRLGEALRGVDRVLHSQSPTSVALQTAKRAFAQRVEEVLPAWYEEKQQIDLARLHEYERQRHALEATRTLMAQRHEAGAELQRRLDQARRELESSRDAQNVGTVGAARGDDRSRSGGGRTAHAREEDRVDSSTSAAAAGEGEGTHSGTHSSPAPSSPMADAGGDTVVGDGTRADNNPGAAAAVAVDVDANTGMDLDMQSIQARMMARFATQEGREQLAALGGQAVGGRSGGGDSGIDSAMTSGAPSAPVLPSTPPAAPAPAAAATLASPSHSAAGQSLPTAAEAISTALARAGDVDSDRDQADGERADRTHAQALSEPLSDQQRLRALRALVAQVESARPEHAAKSYRAHREGDASASTATDLYNRAVAGAESAAGAQSDGGPGPNHSVACAAVLAFAANATSVLFPSALLLGRKLTADALQQHLAQQRRAGREELEQQWTVLERHMRWLVEATSSASTTARSVGAGAGPTAMSGDEVASIFSRGLVATTAESDRPRAQRKLFTFIRGVLAEPTAGDRSSEAAARAQSSMWTTPGAGDGSDGGDAGDDVVDPLRDDGFYAAASPPRSIASRQRTPPMNLAQKIHRLADADAGDADEDEFIGAISMSGSGRSTGVGGATKTSDDDEFGFAADS